MPQLAAPLLICLIAVVRAEAMRRPSSAIKSTSDGESMPIFHNFRGKLPQLLLPVLVGFLSGSTGAQIPAISSNTVTPLAEQTRWSIRLPKETAVAFQGSLSLDGAGPGAYQMMYPAPNAAGLIAAIITHGILAESTKNEQKRKLQTEADKILVPYQPLIESSTHQKLFEKALLSPSLQGDKSLVATNEKPQGDWWMDITPVYTMTQDQSSMILDNVTLIYTSNSSEKASYQNTIRVVSRAKTDDDLLAAWTGNEGQAWHQTTAEMLAQAVSIAVSDWQGAFSSADTTQRTIRYNEGRSEKMERAQLLSENCETSIIKTLRGWMMAVPTRDSIRQKLGCATTSTTVQATPPAAAASGTPTAAVN
ncbi:MAG: hypothetical protein AB3X44_04045 [Leptothrix sp. (in: b-proteobacteria)]